MVMLVHLLLLLVMMVLRFERLSLYIPVSCHLLAQVDKAPHAGPHDVFPRWVAFQHLLCHSHLYGIRPSVARTRTSRSILILVLYLGK